MCVYVLSVATSACLYVRACMHATKYVRMDTCITICTYVYSYFLAR